MKVPDVIGPVTGYRFWKYQTGKLRSTGVSYNWKPGTNTALHVSASHHFETCPEYPGPVPMRACACGFWAYSERAFTDVYFNVQFQPSHAYVMGRVKMWGRVVPHTHGYRAQFVRVDALFPSLGDWDMTDLALRYDVPLLKVEQDRIVVGFYRGG